MVPKQPPLKTSQTFSNIFNEQNWIVQHCTPDFLASLRRSLCQVQPRCPCGSCCLPKQKCDSQGPGAQGGELVNPILVAHKWSPWRGHDRSWSTPKWVCLENGVSQYPQQFDGSSHHHFRRQWGISWGMAMDPFYPFLYCAIQFWGSIVLTLLVVLSRKETHQDGQLPLAIRFMIRLCWIYEPTEIGGCNLVVGQSATLPLFEWRLRLGRRNCYLSAW